jgi:hypothetical protein
MIIASPEAFFFFTGKILLEHLLVLCVAVRCQNLAQKYNSKPMISL